MNTDIFNSTKNWQYSALDQLAEAKFSEFQAEARKNAPEQFYHIYTLTHLDYMRSTKLYSLLKTLPKAVMHHNHFDCNEDEDFYRLHVITDPNVYLAADRKTFKIGNKQQAKQEGWISFPELRKQYANEEELVKAVSNITMFSKSELSKLSCRQKEMWDTFQGKICNFFPLLFHLGLFKKYVKFILQKYIKNGYDRIEFRAFLARLTEYDEMGNKVMEHDEKMFMTAFDEMYNQVRQEHPHFTVGFVFFGLKAFNQEQNTELFTKICELNWDKTIGLDFVQQQDLFGSLQEYDHIIDKVLAKYPHLLYKKVYHAGQTKNHLTHNIDVAVKAGSVRIGHGLNILQRVEFLPYCKHICFQKNPISNLLLGYKNDTREASAPVLLGLGYAVTINPDDPGKFGVEDSTADYFVSAVSYNWTFKHLKLIAYHSINHAICSSAIRRNLLVQFNKRWEAWTQDFIQKYVKKQNQNELIQSVKHRYVEPDIYTMTSGWEWSASEEQALKKFQSIRTAVIDKLPQDFYHLQVLSHLPFMKESQLYTLLHSLPKGALHHLHLVNSEDTAFYQQHIINDPNIYITKERRFAIGTAKQAQQAEWTSLKQEKQKYPNQQAFLKAIASLSIITEEEMKEVAGNSKKFWDLFQFKISNFNTLVFTVHVFRAYLRHLFNKYLSNGYQRLEFRALLTHLREFDAEGNLLHYHPESKYTEIVDEVYRQVRLERGQFTIGFIFFGLKSWPEEKSKERLEKVCELNWDKTIGFDFIQQENSHGSLQKYDAIIDPLLIKHPHLHYKKVYHAGESSDHLNKNIEIAVKAGSARIGTGLNVMQNIQFLQFCKNVCFQVNPISNIVTGASARTDLRLSTAPLLLGLGYPVSISPDDPGKFGYPDTTVDYFAAAVSFNWTLKHLKLIAIHSINHAVCTEGVRRSLRKQFNERWQDWINVFIEK